ncbi:MAG: hypothetical protein BWX66_01654 [Deltaproteobacteria bacterium ADurb.Bin058]|nr:MAG: hypothetical protein BWX66_01654 [Deltaproteobacteria bacterium ADurb.Bin058]
MTVMALSMNLGPLAVQLTIWIVMAMDSESMEVEGAFVSQKVIILRQLQGIVTMVTRKSSQVRLSVATDVTTTAMS